MHVDVETKFKIGDKVNMFCRKTIIQVHVTNVIVNVGKESTDISYLVDDFEVKSVKEADLFN